MQKNIEKLCQDNGIKLTEGRRVIFDVVSKATDHPDVEEVLRRVNKINPKIGIATVYRTLRLFEEAGIITKHEFGTNKAHYEFEEEDDHHDHLIDLASGKIHEFFNAELEELKEKIAKNMGYELVGHKLELYCKPIKKK